MSFVVPNEGEAQMLNVLFQKSAPENLTLKLFSNNITPAETDTATTYTECTGSNYAAIALAASDFTITAGTGAPGNTTFAGAKKTFTLNGALTAYGYYIIGATSGKVYFAEKFSDGPYILPSGGGTIDVTPGGNLE